MLSTLSSVLPKLPVAIPQDVILLSPYGWTLFALIFALVLAGYALPGEKQSSSDSRKKVVEASSTMLVASWQVSTNTPPSPGHVSVSKILVHPIKSCRGISVQTARFTPEGLENDRLWCIIDAVKVNVVTAREIGKMVLITPSIETDGTLKIAFPKESGCEELSIPLRPTEDTLKTWDILPNIIMWPTHPAMDGYICESIIGPKGTASVVLSKFIGRPVHLAFKGPQPRRIDPTTAVPDLVATAKYQDMYPLLVLSEESTGAIEKELRGHVGTQGIEERWKTDRIVIERFRPNIIFRGGGPFAEDNWREIQIGTEGAPRITLVSKCTRCLLPNVSPETGERDKAVPYKVLMKFRMGLESKHRMKACVGCNGVPSGDGIVRVGDPVYIRKMA
ncbi:unnamed protein product [Cyclocybe aegerita]|uniref:MOSC domain-containing protein n=1 Tax=Cyclocybe aegerita TaxID=1973307 RepID=A0A8S0XPU9_CYCAE|nr:unnamed protein product [Cyclocybe aegerita]